MIFLCGRDTLLRVRSRWSVTLLEFLDGLDSLDVGYFQNLQKFQKRNSLSHRPLAISAAFGGFYGRLRRSVMSRPSMPRNLKSRCCH